MNPLRIFYGIYFRFFLPKNLGYASEAKEKALLLLSQCMAMNVMSLIHFAHIDVKIYWVFVVMAGFVIANLRLAKGKHKKDVASRPLVFAAWFYAVVSIAIWLISAGNSLKK